jgi:hypothetical protein
MAKKQVNINTSIAGSLTTSVASYGSTITVNNSFGTSLTTTAGSGHRINYQPKTKYHILGEDVEVSGYYQDGTTVMMIATLNVLGKPFLDELHKNRTFFPQEIEEYLEKKFKWLERDKKIDDIIN